MPELISCYYYAPHNHSLLGQHLRHDLEHMVSLGTDAVAFCLQETQTTNWHQQRVRNVVDLAHQLGLQVHLVPNRWAGLVAGWIDGFSHFSLNHPETFLQAPPDVEEFHSEWVSCVNHPKVREHIRSSIELCLREIPFDGFIWDEPHAAPCRCPYCREICGEAGASDRQYHEMFAAFIDEMSAYAKELRPGCVVSLFTQPFQRTMIETLAGKPHIDYLGSDGHIRRPEYQMHRMKGTIFEAHETFYPILEAAGQKSYFLLEAQRHRNEDLEEYLEQVERAFSLPMDHLMYYYSAHEMSLEHEDRFNAATWEQVARIARSRS